MQNLDAACKMLDMTTAQARKQLRACVKKLGGQKFVAKAIGCSVPMVSRVLKGDKSFGPELAAKIQKRFKIPAKAWTKSRKKAKP